MSGSNQYLSSFPTALSTDLSSNQNNDFFILYGAKLDFHLLTQFKQKCGENFAILTAWEVENNQVALLQGKWLTDYQKYANELQIDIAHLNFDTKLSSGGLLVMDMDSTIIEMECIDEIAKLAGSGEMVAEITERAMRGELDFAQSLRKRVATLKDAPEQILQQVRENLPLMPGLQSTIKTLQQYGWKTAIASGGFTYFADYLKALLNLDYAVSNRFEIINGKLTGQVLGDIVDAQYKANTLLSLQKTFNISHTQTVAIGDGANDLTMMKSAGLGIAYHAKPKVQQQAQIVVNCADLTALLCILSANDKLNELRKE